MKVWINKASGGYVGGLAIVAARSAEEAHGVLMKEIGVCISFYDINNWEECQILTANIDTPCFIAEDSYDG